MPQFDIVLLPNHALVERWRKRRALEAAAGLFAQTVTTFDAWISDLWELHGDGRVLVDNAQRAVALELVLNRCEGMPQTPGMAALAARCVRMAAGVETFERALGSLKAGAHVEGLSSQESEFLNAIAQYLDFIHAHNLVEPGEAAALLAQRANYVFTQPRTVLLADLPPLTWIQRQFFDSCPQLQVEVDQTESSEGVAPAPPDTELRFGFPSGRLAQPALVADILRDWAARADAPANRTKNGMSAETFDIVVACKRPRMLLDQLHDVIDELDMSGAAQESVPFAQTDFGKAFLGMYHAVNDDLWNPAFIQDALMTPFSGLSRRDALAQDTRIRENRIIEREELLAWMRINAEPLSQLEELVCDPEADILLGVFESMATARAQSSPAWSAEQLAAIAALRKTTSAARRMGADTNTCIHALEHVGVMTSIRCGKPVVANVAFTTLDMAAQLGDGCCSTLIATDLTSQDYPLSSKEDAVDTLFRKLGLVDFDTALAKARRSFNALVKCPSSTLYLVRPLADDSADETYPSTVLEEFVDAYRADPTATDDIDNLYRLPDFLQANLLKRGEEHLFANAAALPKEARQPELARIDWPGMADLGKNGPYEFTPRRRTPEGDLLPGACPSPSQIEAYLECPYRWYAVRRLGATSPDEGFGPLEKGSFAHEAFELFYHRFQEAGFAKVDAGNLDRARDMMADVVKELIADQLGREPGSGRLVASSELERRELAALERQLIGYIDYESRLLPGFHPIHLEYKIDVDRAVEYAGGHLVGSVDRIDCDENGHAVIIDYKSSVNDAHWIAGKTPASPGKVQTRIYAQAVKRCLGLDVVGALYVSYGAKPSAAGAFDPNIIGETDLPGAQTKKGACTATCGSDELPEDLAASPLPSDFDLKTLSFAQLLDATEGLAAQAIARMTAACVPPRPQASTACDYCPITTCHNRGEQA